MKIQRMPALTVFEMSACALIRVVPPRFSVPYRDGKPRRFFVFHKWKNGNIRLDFIPDSITIEKEKNDGRQKIS